MGSSPSVPEPTPEERAAQASTSRLTNLQIDDLLAKRQADAYAQSPAVLNQQWAKDQTKTATGWNTSKNTALQAARQQITNAFTDVGDPTLASPYLAALDNAAANLHYTPGEQYHYDGTPAPNAAWDEQAFLTANPIVKSQLALKGTPFGNKVDFSSGEEYYNKYGKAAGITAGVNPNYGKTLQDVAHVIGGTDPVYDDPNSLLNSDYGVTQAVTGIRQGRKDTAYNNALGTVSNYLTGLGLNDADRSLLTNKVTGSLKNVYDTAGVTSNDYSKVFDPQTILDSTIGAERNLRRGQYTTQAKAAFSGVDPNADFSDTADDQYINDYVGSQYNDAFNALDRAYKRGALTDTGYNAGLGELGRNKASAIDVGNTLGGAVLTRDRGVLGDIKSKAVTDAGGYDFGQSYDPYKYIGEYDTKRTSLRQGLGGEISTALQGQNFFDVGNVLNKAGFAQGAQNTSPLATDSNSPDYLAALGEKNKNKTASRGLGGTGVF